MTTTIGRIVPDAWVPPWAARQSGTVCPVVGDGERVVAGWILEERLGAGGYGEVWRARRRHVDLVRAVKLIPMVSDGAFESWRHEIARLEALNHPNVVRFYDADLVADGPYQGYAWISTELCERSLADTLRAQGHALPLDEGDRLLQAILAALAAAHDAGMVHRDVKPANILRHQDGTWKLCDFGTARLVPTDATHPVTQVVGTSPYMSPAAIRGRQNRAADLYALGATMHEAVRAQRLHPRPEGMNDGQYVERVLRTPPVIASDLPPRWQTIVATLIGQHGELDAAQITLWLGETGGERPPSSGSGGGPNGAPVNGAPATAAPVTGKTEVRVGAAGGTSPATPDRAPASTPPRRVYVPAPASAPAAPSPPPQPAVRPPVAGPPNGSAAPVAPGYGAPPAQAAPDPTDVMGRRIFAAIVDGVLVLALALFLYAGTVIARYDEVPLPVGASGTDDACAVLAPSTVSCVVIGDTIYVSTDEVVTFPPFVVIAALLLLVFLQGLTGAAVGKRLAGLRVIGPQWQRPGVLRALGRTLALVVDAFPYVAPLVGWHLARTTPHHRRVGDLLARTFVVRHRGALPRSR
jgi:serine/threonine protein kinase/uncharacterized RDD family membrane protein YckC